MTQLKSRVIFVLEADAQADAEAQGDVVVGGSEVVPELEAVVVAGVCGISIGITCPYPEVCEESFIEVLIAECAKERSHSRLLTRSGCLTVMQTCIGACVVVMRVYELRTEIESFQCDISLFDEELVSIPQSESHRIIIVLVISCADEASTEFAALMPIRKRSLV